MTWYPGTLRIPVAQQEALPFIPIGGPVTNYAPVVMKYWSSVQLGFGNPANGVPFIGGKGIVSGTISLAGCKELALLAKRTLAADPPAADSLRAYIWPQASDGSASLVKADNLFGFNSNGNGVTPVAGFGTYVYNFTVAVGSQSGGSGNATGAWPLEFAKIAVIGFGTVGDLSFTWEMWGQS